MRSWLLIQLKTAHQYSLQAAELLGLVLSLSWYMRTFLPAAAWLQSLFECSLEHPSWPQAGQQQGQILLLRRNAVSSPGMEQSESIFADFYLGDVFVYPDHPFAFAALLFRLIRAC